MLVPFDPVYVWINNYSGDYCSWPHLVLNKASTSGRNASVWLGEWGRGFWHEGRLKSEIRDWVRPPAFLRAITLQWHDVNKSTNTVLVVKALVTQEIARYCHFITWPPLYLRLPWQQRRAVMLMTVGSSCVPRALSRWNKTHTLSTQRADKTHNREHQITQRDMASHSPQDSDDTSVRPNQSTHTQTHCTLTLRSLKIPCDTHQHSCPWRWHQKVNRERWVHLTATYCSIEIKRYNWVQKSE